MNRFRRFKGLSAVLVIFGCLALAGCGEEEEETPDAPPAEEESFNDTTAGGSA